MIDFTASLRQLTGFSGTSCPHAALPRITPRPNCYATATAATFFRPSSCSTPDISCRATSHLASVRHDSVGDSDTIAAVVSSGQGGSVAIIRLSGQAAVAVAQQVFRRGGGARDWRPKTHRIYYGHVLSTDSAVIDEVLVLVMLAPRSYTTEDVVEIHCHGGGVSAQRVLDRCLQAGCRLARPGEFTLRAFLNGRIDLSQAESVMQLVGARTPSAADSALAGLEGGIGQEVRRMRQALVELLAEIEARLDFDEELPNLDYSDVTRRIGEIQQQVEAALATSRQGRLLRSGLQVALVGCPNVGKSSLLNALSRSNRAIVTDIAGTTRDVVDITVAIRGIPVTLLDTAGIRDSVDAVERIGIARSRAAAAAADIVIMVYDAQAGWSAGDGELFSALWMEGEEPSRVRAPSILLANKSDAVGAVNFGRLPKYCHDRFDSMIAASAKELTNLAEVEAAIERLAMGDAVSQGGVAWAVNDRQSQALVKAHESLMKTCESVRAALPLDFWTIDLRDALYALGEVTGDAVTEEVLDVVFSKFCIGK